MEYEIVGQLKDGFIVMLIYVEAELKLTVTNFYVSGQSSNAIETQSVIAERKSMFFREPIVEVGTKGHQPVVEAEILLDIDRNSGG